MGPVLPSARSPRPRSPGCLLGPAGRHSYHVGRGSAGFPAPRDVELVTAAARQPAGDKTFQMEPPLCKDKASRMHGLIALHLGARPPFSQDRLGTSFLEPTRKLHGTIQLPDAAASECLSPAATLQRGPMKPFKDREARLHRPAPRRSFRSQSVALGRTDLRWPTLQNSDRRAEVGGARPRSQLERERRNLFPVANIWAQGGVPARPGDHPPGSIANCSFSVLFLHRFTESRSRGYYE